VTLTFFDFALLCAFGLIFLIVVEISLMIRLSAHEKRMQTLFNRVVLHAESYDVALKHLDARMDVLERWHAATTGQPLPRVQALNVPPPSEPKP
jgi:hypothetical protein